MINILLAFIFLHSAIPLRETIDVNGDVLYIMPGKDSVYSVVYRNLEYYLVKLSPCDKEKKLSLHGGHHRVMWEWNENIFIISNNCIDVYSHDLDMIKKISLAELGEGDEYNVKNLSMLGETKLIYGYDHSYLFKEGHIGEIGNRVEFCGFPIYKEDEKIHFGRNLLSKRFKKIEDVLREAFFVKGVFLSIGNQLYDLNGDLINSLNESDYIIACAGLDGGGYLIEKTKGLFLIDKDGVEANVKFGGNMSSIIGRFDDGTILVQSEKDCLIIIGKSVGDIVRWKSSNQVFCPVIFEKNIYYYDGKSICVISKEKQGKIFNQ